MQTETEEQVVAESGRSINMQVHPDGTRQMDAIDAFIGAAGADVQHRPELRKPTCLMKLI